jgi:aspartyl aminopeptidase
MSLINNLFDFINESPTAYHTVAAIKSRLLSAGFTELFLNAPVDIEDGKGYFVTRGDSSIIAFRALCEPDSFLVTASHSDSPTFRIKRSGEKLGVCSRLDVEKYGGSILYTWFDRPLGIAGRVLLETKPGVKSELVTLDTTVVIPSVAPHLNREVNSSFAPNPAIDLLPIYTLDLSGDRLIAEIAEKLGVKKETILSYDLSLYNKAEATTAGADNELIVSPRLDDLEAVSASLEAFLAAKRRTGVMPVFAVFDNEEVGSATKQGAASGFLADVLERISADRESYIASLASSFMVSADNAHAKHPAHPEFSDPAFAPLLSGGVVIKYNANQRYTTDAISSAVFEKICKDSGVKVQYFRNRADKLGGSTLGSISNTKVSVSTIDIGIAQLAMHSAVETASLIDVLEMKKALTAFYGTRLEKNAEEIVIK